jgi:hypothetical protein
MWPSGPWRGFWEQVVWGRRWMEPLTLRFEGGRVEGEGYDVIGVFTFAGTYTERGTVHMVKQYVGKHSVQYDGRVDGEGAVTGEWSIAGAWSGPFMLMPVVADASQMAITDIAPPPG